MAQHVITHKTIFVRQWGANCKLKAIIVSALQKTKGTNSVVIVHEDNWTKKAPPFATYFRKTKKQAGVKLITFIAGSEKQFIKCRKKLIFVLNAVDIDPTAAANEKFVLSHNYDVSLSNCNPPTTTHTNKKSVFNVKFFVWLRNAICREREAGQHSRTV